MSVYLSSPFVRKRNLGRSVGLADGALLAAGDELALASHEVGVAADLVVVVHPGHDLVKEAGDLVVGAGCGELADEDLLVVGDKVAGVIDVLLEVLDVLGAVVPVDVDAVDGAVRAGLKERGEPVEAHGAGTVGDGGGAELGIASERLHVLLVSGGSLLGAHVGLLVKVGLVEREEVGGARLDGGLGVVGPVVGELRGRAPKSGNELDGVRETGAGRAPVVTPRNGWAVDKAVGQLGVVVGDTALAALATAARGAASGGGSSAGRAGVTVATEVDVDVLVGGGVGQSRGRALLGGGRGRAGGGGRRVSGGSRLSLLGDGLSLGAVGSRGLGVSRGRGLAGRDNSLSRARRLNRSGLGRSIRAGSDGDGLLDGLSDSHIAGASSGCISDCGLGGDGSLDVGDDGGLADGGNRCLSTSSEARAGRVDASAVGARVGVSREARRLVVVVLGVSVAVSGEGNGEGSGGESQNAHGVDRGHCIGGFW